MNYTITKEKKRKNISSKLHHEIYRKTVNFAGRKNQLHVYGIRSCFPSMFSL
jgi:hypothetical protein